MKAKFTSLNVSNARQPNNKETVNTLTLTCFKKGEFHTPVTARFYMGRSSSASVVYCCLWVNGTPVRSSLPKSIMVPENPIHISGRGSAGGGGYHKESAALDEALRSAGIELWGSAYQRRGEKEDFRQRAYINGVGASAMQEALLTIGRALGYTDKQMKVI